MSLRLEKMNVMAISVYLHSNIECGNPVGIQSLHSWFRYNFVKPTKLTGLDTWCNKEYEIQDLSIVPKLSKVVELRGGILPQDVKAENSL